MLTASIISLGYVLCSKPSQMVHQLNKKILRSSCCRDLSEGLPKDFAAPG